MIKKIVYKTHTDSIPIFFFVTYCSYACNICFFFIAKEAAQGEKKKKRKKDRLIKPATGCSNIK